MVNEMEDVKLLHMSSVISESLNDGRKVSHYIVKAYIHCMCVDCRYMCIGVANIIQLHISFLT